MKILISMTLTLLSTLAPLASLAEQQVLFCAETFHASPNFRRDQCKVGCAKFAPDSCLQSQINAGWKIAASTPRHVRPLEDGIDCTCEGQEYILNKDEVKSSIQVEKENQREREFVLLNKENDLLKIEISQLKSEMENLRNQILTSKTKPSKNKP